MKSIFVLFLLLFAQAAVAQDMSHIYAVGTAVPGGIQELTPFPGNKFKYAGTLRQGTLRLTNTPTPAGIKTRYLKSTYEDSYVVTGPVAFTLAAVRDSSASEWIVPFTEDTYRFTVDISGKTLQGEIFRPWNELFIVGGATECGWVTYTFLPFTRDEDEICAWDWTGELRERPEYGEPRRFKFNGQNAWDPKVLHPFTSDEDILKSTQILTNGSGDNKWQITKEGIYHIRVDVFRETVKAEYLGPSPTMNGPTNVTAPSEDFALSTRNREILLNCPSGCTMTVCSADGQLVSTASGTRIAVTVPGSGIYLVRLVTPSGLIIRKVRM